MPHSITRRDLLKKSALAGAGVWIGLGSASAQNRRRSPNEKLNVGVIGAGGRGANNRDGVGATENIVALCDVDEGRLNEAGERYPQAEKYVDFRKLLERTDLDAVTVSTADHTHAHASIWAMEQGIHVYCEKPLTHSIWEAREMARVARRNRIVTQMGNQGHSNNGTRRVVEIVRAGVVGDISRVHAWSNRPIWPQGIDRPEPQAPPSTMHWDLWLGGAPERPYNRAYAPFNWRGWYDFGTGALGDMACHVMDTAFWALDLGSPDSVVAWGEPRKPETYPNWAIIDYYFPARGKMGPVHLTWYDGGKKPDPALVGETALGQNGSILIGAAGTIYLPGSYGDNFRLLPAEKFAAAQLPPESIPRSPGHYQEWINGIKNGDYEAPKSNFSYAGPLTEMVLLGCVALRVGHRIEWNGKRMRVKNCDDAEQYIQPEYRAGWEL